MLDSATNTDRRAVLWAAAVPGANDKRRCPSHGFRTRRSDTFSVFETARWFASTSRMFPEDMAPSEPQGIEVGGVIEHIELLGPL